MPHKEKRWVNGEYIEVDRVNVVEWCEEHIMALIGLGIFLLVVGMGYVFYDLIILQDPIEYFVIAEKVETNKISYIGIIDKITMRGEEFNIHLDVGTGLLGLKDIKRFYYLESDEQLLPSDTVKVTVTSFKGIDCIFIDKDGVEHDKKERSVNLDLTGDRCGEFNEYEVEKLR